MLLLVLLGLVDHLIKLVYDFVVENVVTVTAHLFQVDRRAIKSGRGHTVFLISLILLLELLVLKRAEFESKLLAMPGLKLLVRDLLEA